MTLSQWAPLVSYPGEDYQARVRECGQPLVEFAREIDGLTVERLQELYTQTFDWNPDTTLDIGWHLFGEDYNRGDFLVKLRGALRAHGVAESQELPDHLSHVLPLMDRMPEGDRAEFAAKYVLPATGKLRDSLAKAVSPFLPMMIALREQVATLVPETAVAGADHE